MDDDTFLYIITFFVVIGSIALILIEYVFKKWKCKEGKCEKVFGGDYSTIKECLASKDCASVPQKSGYDCVNNSCIASIRDDPLYASQNECNNNCGVQTVPDYSYGTPYSYGAGLYPHGLNYGYGRRWWPRRRSPRRRSPVGGRVRR
jgi:hypothetical protein